MDTLLGIVLFAAYIAAVLAVSAGMTMLVIRISPSQAAREQRARRKAEKAT